MGKCLITKLQGSINNESITKLNEVKAFYLSNMEENVGKYYIGNSTSMRIVGDAYFTDSSGNTNNGKILNSDGMTYIKAFGDAVLFISNKYDLTEISFKNDRNEVLNLEDLAYCTKIKILTSTTKTIGDVSNLKNMKDLNSIEFNFASKITGDFGEALDGKLMTMLDIMQLPYITLDISHLAASKATLTRFRADSTSGVSGDISNFAEFNNINYIHITGTRINGSIESLKNCENLNELKCGGCNLSGDIALLPSTCYFFLAYPQDTLLSWSNRDTTKNIIGLSGVNLGSSVDTMLINQANCQKPSKDIGVLATIQVIGTRTSASDAAVSTLQNKGYTISVSEL